MSVSTTSVGITAMPRSVTDTIGLAQASELLGFDAFGVGDGHFLHSELYAVITAAMLSTTSIELISTTTNNVSRAWSVHASAARTFEQLSPGRFVLGLSTGDGSVRSLGLRPQSWAELEADAARIRAHGPPGVRIQCTASGIRGARAAGQWADALVLGSGVDTTALRTLAEEARSVPRSQGRNPIKVWAMILAVVVKSEDEIPATRDALRMGAYAVAHFAFGSTFEGKNVPDSYQAEISARLAGYDYRYHGLVTDENPNLRLFDDHPEIGEYLIDRMCLIGTEDDLRRRLDELCRMVPLDGLWLNAQDEETIHRLAAVRPH